MRLLFCLGTALAVTPVEKVVELLTKLQAKTEAEGQAEAVAYDKFACFCKETASDKVYAIEQEDKAIAKLEASIEELSTAIEALDADVAQGNKEIAELEKESEEEVARRAKEREEFEKKYASVNRAITACKRAVTALQESRPDAMLLQRALSLVSLHDVAHRDVARLEALVSQKPAGYEYHSSEIIELLQSLTKQFKAKAEGVYSEESSAKHAHNKAEQARQFTIKTTQEAVDLAARTSATKSEEKSSQTEDKDNRTADRNADQDFLDDLTKQCEDKAKSWDQRSSTRSNELTALAEAISLLKGAGGQKYGANKKLVGLLRKRATVEPTYVDDDEPTSFVQTRHVDYRAGKVFDFIRRKASQLKSVALTSLAMELKKDHFVKVRQLIKDLITKLKDQAEAEATAKEQCDKDMKDAITKRDESVNEMEQRNAAITTNEANIHQLKTRIKELSAQIAELQRALRERTELRNEERKENEVTIADAEEGKTAIDGAVKVLKNFYENAFIQEPDYTTYKAEGSDREGNTVADVAPDSFEGDYHGGQEESKGIFGLLDVIKTDYERSIESTNQAETDAQIEFEQYETDTKTDMDEKEQEKKDAKSDKEKEEADLVENEDAHADASKEHDIALKLLEGLKADCVDDELTHEQRLARRKQEIESLKEALNILEEMSFLSRK